MAQGLQSLGAQQYANTQAQQCVVEQTMVRNATNRMTQRTGDLSSAILDLAEIINRLVGSEPPEAGNKAGPAPVPNGDVQALHAEIDSYERTFLALQHQITRLRSV